MKYYHGTSYTGALSILEHGFDALSTIWNCSDNRMTYLASGTDKEEDEDREAFCIAVEAAQIAAAFVNQMETDTVVFEFDIPESVAENFVSEDDSCENMYNCYEIKSNDLNWLMETGKIKASMHLLKNGYNPNYRIFLLPVNNKYLNEIEDEVFLRAAEVVSKSDAFMYVMDDILGCYDEDIVNTFEEARYLHGFDHAA